MMKNFSNIFNIAEKIDDIYKEYLGENLYLLDYLQPKIVDFLNQDRNTPKVLEICKRHPSFLSYIKKDHQYFQYNLNKYYEKCIKENKINFSDEIYCYIIDHIIEFDISSRIGSIIPYDLQVKFYNQANKDKKVELHYQQNRLINLQPLLLKNGKLDTSHILVSIILKWKDIQKNINVSDFIDIDQKNKHIAKQVCAMKLSSYLTTTDIMEIKKLLMEQIDYLEIKGQDPLLKFTEILNKTLEAHPNYKTTTELILESISDYKSPQETISQEIK